MEKTLKENEMTVPLASLRDWDMRLSAVECVCAIGNNQNSKETLQIKSIRSSIQELLLKV